MSAGRAVSPAPKSPPPDEVRLQPPSRTDAPRQVRIRRRAALALGVLWIAALLVLVVTSANPPVVNREQLLRADAVVAARILDKSSGACRLERQWSGADVPHWFVVRDLRQTAVNSGEVWILPLSTRGRDFEITRSRLPSGARLVYPAQPDVLQQVDELFDQQSRSRD